MEPSLYDSVQVWQQYSNIRTWKLRDKYCEDLPAASAASVLRSHLRAERDRQVAGGLRPSWAAQRATITGTELLQPAAGTCNIAFDLHNEEHSTSPKTGQELPDKAAELEDQSGVGVSSSCSCWM